LCTTEQDARGQLVLLDPEIVDQAGGVVARLVEVAGRGQRQLVDAGGQAPDDLEQFQILGGQGLVVRPEQVFGLRSSSSSFQRRPHCGHARVVVRVTPVIVQWLVAEGWSVLAS